jgi:hypothetical protein
VSEPVRSGHGRGESKRNQEQTKQDGQDWIEEDSFSD